MQFETGVAADIIQVIQALVLAFVAAPTIIRDHADHSALYVLMPMRV